MAGLKERTLCIIKPDAVAKKAIGGIVAMIEDEGFDILGLRMTRLTMDDAMAFYVVHKERPFYGPLAQFMASGPIVAMVLEKEGAIADLRRLMGATDSRKAEEGTIRAKFGTDIERNAVHGSDSPESARFEIPFFFSQSDLQPKDGA